MSFSSEVKSELSRIIPRGKHCRIASLAAILSCVGIWEEGQDGLRLSLDTDNPQLIGKCFTLFEKTTNISLKLSPERNMTRVLAKEEDLLAAAELLQMTDGDGRVRTARKTGVPDALLARACCRRSYLRDTFLCIGSMSDPSREYHLEFDAQTGEHAQQIRQAMEDCGIGSRIIRRKKYHVVYVKDSTAIVTLLTMMGAHASLLEMENARILKEVRNQVNRRVNCETANIGKTVSAAQHQIEDIRLLEEKGVLKELPEKLRKAAELRLEYPEAALQELGGLMVPPVGKSGMNHRLRKLSELAAGYRTT